MRDRGRTVWVWAGLAAAALVALLWVGVVGGAEDDADESRVEPATTPAGGLQRGRPPENDGPERSEQPGVAGAGGREVGRGLSRPDREDLAERRALRAARRAYRSYLLAINARSGESLCRMIAPGFLDELRPPARGGDCPDRIRRSIGFRDPRGTPVWESTTLNGFESALLGGEGGVQLSATITTAFADRSQPSVETDIAYLEPVAGGYRFAKASAAMWRAVGKPDVPPQVIAPPRGF